MTQYKFSVNSQSVVGNLTWNANGTLASLAITDPFNSANAQSCSHSHDDLARIGGANCGSAWSQTFTNDAFGNLNKSGTQSFQPTYSYLTNHMTQIGSSTPAYDGGNHRFDKLPEVGAAMDLRPLWEPDGAERDRWHGTFEFGGGECDYESHHHDGLRL